MNQGAKTIMIAAVALAVGAGGAVLAMNAGGASAGRFSGADRAAIETIVREYILAHPEILPEAMQNLERKESAKAVSDNRDPVMRPFAGAWEGAAEGDVVLVKFFDYACGYCQAARADVERLISEDPKLKVVYRELPILGPESGKAAQVSLALAKVSPAAFSAFHKALYSAGRPGDATIDAAIRAAGQDPATIRAAAQGDDIRKEIETNLGLQRSLRLSGTPAWVVGTQLINGAVGYDALKAAIAEARKSG